MTFMHERLQQSRNLKVQILLIFFNDFHKNVCHQLLQEKPVCTLSRHVKYQFTLENKFGVYRVYPSEIWTFFIFHVITAQQSDETK